MKVRLGDVCNIQSGGTPSRSKEAYWREGNIHWVKISDMKDQYIYDTEECITTLGVQNSSAKIFPKDTILYSIFATIGEVSILKIEAATNQAIAGIQIIDNRIYANYLYYYLLSMKFKMNNIGRGVAQNNINISILKNIEIHIRSLDEQKRIVMILDKVNQLITKRYKQLEKLDELVKAKFVEMFGDPISNCNQLPIVSLGELGQWSSGGTPTRTIPEYFSGDIDWYSAGELNSLYLDSAVEKITPEAINKSAAKLFARGSLLVGMYDTAAFKMGILKRTSASNQACACIEPNERVNIVWLYHTLQLMKDYFLSQRRGVRQKNLNLGMIKSFYIPITDRLQQDEFSVFVDRIEKIKTTISTNLKMLELLKKSLMQKYFF